MWRQAVASPAARMCHRRSVEWPHEPHGWSVVAELPGSDVVPRTGGGEPVMVAYRCHGGISAEARHA